MVEMGNGTFVCDGCINDMHAFVEAAAREAAVAPIDGTLTPKAIVSFLNDYVIGQDAAKQTLALAVYNHYKRLGYQGPVELAKSNVLVLGPTGTGKTLLAESIARLLNVPFVVADATSLTQAGYVGDDVETILQRLLQAAGGDIAKAERGIVFIDEIDKLAKASAGASLTRDVSGEGVQQALLKLIEGARVSVQVSGNRKAPGTAVNYIDTKNILFICGGAFTTLLEKLTQPANKGTIGFTSAPAPAPDAAEVTPEKLFEFGLIPEFVGRLPVITVLEPLDAAAIERIIVEPKNAVVKQMAELLALDGAKLVLEEGVVAAVAAKTLAMKTGARGARGVLEGLLRTAMFEVPGTSNATVTVRADLSVGIVYGDASNSESSRLAA